MRALAFPVPYADRRLLTRSGTAVVWPFVNVEKGCGPYELFLDTNALSDVSWFQQLPDSVRENSVVNPWPALQEEWLSNPLFRDSVIERIRTMTAPLAHQGAHFRDQFAEQQARILNKNDAALRSQFSTIIPYVAIMKSLLREALSAQEAQERLETIAKQDIPRFTGALMLTALTTFLRRSQWHKLAEDSKPAFSLLNSFLEFQPSSKNETNYMNVAYLRNRAADLNLWLSLPALWSQGYQFLGTPAIVTGDAPLHRVICRVIPPFLHQDRKFAIGLSPEGLPEELCKRIVEVGQRTEVRSIHRSDEQLARMARLFALAKDCCSEERERQALDEVEAEWWRPGFGRKVDLS